MTTPVLFLEATSGYTEEIGHDVAAPVAKQLVSTLRRARKVNSKLALNCGTPLRHCNVASNWTLSAALGGNTYREEWEYLKTLADRSPLSSGLEEWLSMSEVREATTGGVKSQALEWASLLETGTISFFAKSNWQQSWVEARCFWLDDDGEEHYSVERIRNASALEHVDEHETWLRTLGYERLPTAAELWSEKLHRFPGLRFLLRVDDDLAVLATSGAPYRQALATLEILSLDAQNWNLTLAAPQFSVKVSPEHEHRRDYCHLNDDATGDKQYFDTHARFTGGIPGRIHFRVDHVERKLVVAYIGFKLDGPIKGPK